MCGIAGWFAPKDALERQLGTAEPGALDARLSAMMRAIAHRGPDDARSHRAPAAGGAWDLALGHQRLAIIDLDGGVQPMASADRAAVLAFNGQIYNYKTLRAELEGEGRDFATQSDTEVALAAYERWGRDAFARFRGMFAIAIWDAPRETLVLARDRFGQKPLFWRKLPGGGLAFASEIKALLAGGLAEARFRADALEPYLLYRYVPAPATFFAEIEKTPPASITEIDPSGRIEQRPYWVAPDREAKPDRRAIDDPIGAFAETFDQSVRLRMASDVPYGAFLSGGIDSSAVVAAMSRHHPGKIKTFAVGFEEAQYSELRWAKAVADRFDCEHSELTIRAEAVIDHLEEAIDFRDAPVAEPSDVPILLLSREAAKSVKMVLTGEGSDEILAGYPKHRFEPFAALYRKLAPSIVRERAIEPAIGALPYRFRRAKTLVDTLGIADPRERWPRWFGALGPSQRARLLAGVPSGDAAHLGDATPFSPDPAQSALRKILHFDQTSWLPDNLLERGDRMTMAASLEARMPFLDHKLAALMARLPDRWRIGGLAMTGAQKRILRSAFARQLPPGVVERPKVGFRVPVNLWFRNTLRPWLEDLLAGPSSRSRPLFEPTEVRAILDQHVEGRRNHEKTLWTLAVFELFLRRRGLQP